MESMIVSSMKRKNNGREINGDRNSNRGKGGRTM